MSRTRHRGDLHTPSQRLAHGAPLAQGLHGCFREYWTDAGNATQQGIAITKEAAATWLPEELRTATGPPRERPTENELGKRKKHLGIAALGASCLEARAGVEPTYTDLQSGA